MQGAPIHIHPTRAHFSAFLPHWSDASANASTHTEDENKGAVTYIHLTHSAALDVRSGYPLQKLISMQTGFQFSPLQTTDNPPGQNVEWNRVGQLDWAFFFLVTVVIFHIISTKKWQVSQFHRFSDPAVTPPVKALFFFFFCVPVPVSGERAWISWKALRFLRRLQEKGAVCSSAVLYPVSSWS